MPGPWPKAKQRQECLLESTGHPEWGHPNLCCLRGWRPFSAIQKETPDSVEGTAQGNFPSPQRGWTNAAACSPAPCEGSGGWYLQRPKSSATDLGKPDGVANGGRARTLLAFWPFGWCFKANAKLKRTILDPPFQPGSPSAKLFDLPAIPPMPDRAALCGVGSERPSLRSLPELPTSKWMWPGKARGQSLSLKVAPPEAENWNWEGTGKKRRGVTPTR